VARDILPLAHEGIFLLRDDVGQGPYSYLAISSKKAKGDPPMSKARRILKLLNEVKALSDKEMLAMLDDVFIKDGKLNQKVYDEFFWGPGRDVAMFLEPDENEDPDGSAAWHDSTLKHQIHDYYDGPLRKTGIWKNSYDLPSVLVRFSSGDADSQEELLDVIKDVKKKGIAEGNTVPTNIRDKMERELGEFGAIEITGMTPATAEQEGAENTFFGAVSDETSKYASMDDDKLIKSFKEHSKHLDQKVVKEVNKALGL